MSFSNRRFIPFGGCATAVGLAILTTSSPAVYAQQAGQTAAAGQGDQLEEIVVTARRREEQLQTTPLSVTAFSGARLEAMNISKLDDISKEIPNLNLSSSVSYPSSVEIYIRGIGEQDTILTNDSPVALYLDGVYVARDIGSLFSFVDLDRIEVLRGPQGTLFGRNTTAGAVSLVTRAPAQDFGITGKLGYASDNEITMKAVIDSGEIGNTGLTAKFSYQHHQMDGYTQNTLDSNPANWPGADDSDSVYFVLHGNLADNLDFDYRFDWTHDVASLVNWQTTYASPGTIAYFGQSPAFGGAPYVVSPNRLGSLAIFPSERSYSDTMGHSLTINYAVSDELSIKSITAYRSLAMSAIDSLTSQGFLLGPTFTGIARVTPYEVQCFEFGSNACDNQHQYQMSQEFQVSGSMDRIKYVGGLYYFTEHVGEFDPQFLTSVFPAGALGPGSAPIGFNFPTFDFYSGKSTSYAAFAQASYTPPILDDRLELTGGIRYTRDEKAVIIFANPSSPNNRLLSHRYNNLSGEFTANYQVADGVIGYFRFSNAYKAGGFNARDPGPGYAPESANSYEGGIKSDWFDKRLRVNADIFYTQYTNQQISSFVANSAGGGAVSTITVNAGASTYLGGELEVSVIPANGWLLNVGFGYTDPEYQQYPYTIGGVVTNIANIVKFPYMSKASLNLGAQYTFDPMPVGDLTVRMDFGYKSGEVFHPNPLASPLIDITASEALEDLGANVTLAHIPLWNGRSELTAEVYGKNLLDRDNRVQGIDFGALGFGINAFGRPRVVGFNLTAKY